MENTLHIWWWLSSYGNIYSETAYSYEVIENDLLSYSIRLEIYNHPIPSEISLIIAPITPILVFDTRTHD